MSKTFKYTKITGHYYCMANNEWEQDGVDFDYEVENNKLLPLIVDLLFYDYFGNDKVICNSEKKKQAIKEKLKKIIDDSDLVVTFADQYEDVLKEYFEEEAMDWYDD